MSIKNQLRAAILSGGATASAPGSKAIDFQGDVYTAPSDGYVCYGVRASAANQWFSIYSAPIENTSSITNEGQNPAMFVPVRKGQQVNLNKDSSCVVNYRRFIKLVGGGKNPVAQLIRRVVLCLRSTFDQCLSRTVDRIRAFLSTGGLLFSIKLSRQVRLIMSLLRQTASWLCSARVQFLLQRTVDTTLAHARREGRGQQLTFPLKKVKQSRSYITILRADQGRYESICTRTLARNLALGGASHA